MKKILLITLALLPCLLLTNCAYIVRKIIEEERQELKADRYYDEANKAYDEEDYEEALELYTLHLKHHENDKEGYYHRALTYFEMERYQKAVDDLLIAVKIDPKYVDAYGNLSWYYIFLEQPDQALKMAKTSIKIDPEYVLPFTNAGHALLMKKQTPQAINYYFKGLDDNAVIEDFKELREAGIILPDMKKVEELFSQRIAALKGKCNARDLADIRANMHEVEDNVKAYYELLGKYPANIEELQLAASKAWGQIKNPVLGASSVALINEGQPALDGVVSYEREGSSGYSIYGYCGHGYKILDEEKYDIFSLYK